jgi:MFS superfamily sulfate permease-like transporter
MNSLRIDLALYLLGGICLLAALALAPSATSLIPLAIANVATVAVIVGRHVVSRDAAKPREDSHQDISN